MYAEEDQKSIIKVAHYSMRKEYLMITAIAQVVTSAREEHSTFVMPFQCPKVMQIIQRGPKISEISEAKAWRQKRFSKQRVNGK